MPTNSNKTPETIHKTKTVEAGEKRFIISFCENWRGKFLRIREEFRGIHNSIIIPLEVADQVLDVADEVLPPE